MGSNRKRTTYKHDITRAVSSIRIKFQRRMTVPMFHPQHIEAVSQLLEYGFNELNRITKLNSLRRVDKLVQAHYVIDTLTHGFANITPADPRNRGAEEYIYGNNGFETIHGLKDLDKIITDTEGEEDHASDRDQWNKWMRESMQRDHEKKHREHNYPKQDPPERQTEGYLQPQDKYVKSVYNKSKYTKSSTQRD